MVTTNSQKLQEVFVALNQNIADAINCITQLEGEESACFEQEGGMLASIIREVKPLLKYLDQKIVVAREWSHDDWLTSRPGQETFLAERGVSLLGGREPATKTKDGKIIFGGSELVLTRSGQLLQLSWSGSRGKNLMDGHYQAAARKLVSYEAVQFYGFREVLEGFQKIFIGAIKKLDERRNSLQKRLDLLKLMEEK